MFSRQHLTERPAFVFSELIQGSESLECRGQLFFRLFAGRARGLTSRQCLKDRLLKHGESVTEAQKAPKTLPSVGQSKFGQAANVCRAKSVFAVISD